MGYQLSPDAVLVLTMAACGIGFGVACYIVWRSSLNDHIAQLEEQLLRLLASPMESIDVHCETTPPQPPPPLRPDLAELLEHLRGVALTLGEQYPDGITTDEIHEAHPIPDTIDGRVLGQVWDREHWVQVGYRKSRLKVNHQRMKAVWRLRKHVAAAE